MSKTKKKNVRTARSRKQRKPSAVTIAELTERIERLERMCQYLQSQMWPPRITMPQEQFEPYRITCGLKGYACQ